MKSIAFAILWAGFSISYTLEKLKNPNKKMTGGEAFESLFIFIGFLITLGIS